MSAGIESIDRGFVWGTTWHGIPSYKQQTIPVTYEQAKEVLDFPLAKKQLYRMNKSGEYEDVNQWCIIREDVDRVLVSGVGSKFQVVPNVDILDRVKTDVLKDTDLKIESVGTLFSGATSFVNILIDVFEVPGDKSPTFNRLMYYNPLGYGAYRVLAHTIRVVCNNTLRMATHEAEKEKRLFKFRHTSSAESRIAGKLVDLAELHEGFKKHKELLAHLAEQKMTERMGMDFTNTFYAIEKDAKEVTKAHVQEDRNELFLHWSKHDPTLNGLNHTRYSMLQSVMYLLDHGKMKSGDQASVTWDGMTGSRAVEKDRALKLLLVS